jgi:hypothetical protein
LLKKQHILKFITGFILVVFAFSITPKKVWHDLLANHKDLSTRNYQIGKRGDQVHKTVINCNCDQLVVESAFVNKASFFSIDIAIVEIDYLVKPYTFSFNSSIYNFGLRGPPMGYILFEQAVA